MTATSTTIEDLGHADLSSRIAALNDEDLRVTPADFTNDLPAMVAFGGLVIQQGHGRQMTWVVEDDAPFDCVDHVSGLEWYGLKPGYRQFGLWLLHLLFSGRNWAGLNLVRASSDFAQLYVQILRPAPNTPDLELAAPPQYGGFRYDPASVVRHAFADGMGGVVRVAPEDRPMIRLGSANQYQQGNADQVILSLSPEGLAAFAALMLDFADDDNATDEINIEAPFVGFAATQPLSLESRFWLPGGFAFLAGDLDDPLA